MYNVFKEIKDAITKVRTQEAIRKEENFGVKTNGTIKKCKYKVKISMDSLNSSLDAI